MVALLALLSSTPAIADDAVPLPPGAREMIDTAVRSGDDTKLKTVVDVAKDTWPEASAAIDAYVDTSRERDREFRYAEIEKGGLLTGWRGEIRLGGSTATGNSSRTNSSIGLEIERDGPDWLHRAEMDLFYSFSSDDDPTKRILAFWQSDYKLGLNDFISGRLGYYKNFSAGIRDRLVESISYGRRFQVNERFGGNLTAGPAARQTRYYDGVLLNDFAVRVGTRLNYDLWKNTRISNVNTLYLAGNSTVDNTVSLRTTVVDGLSIILSFNVQWEENPAPTFEALSTLTSVTIGFSF